MTRQQLQALRDAGLTHAEIGRRHFNPPTNREKVRVLCQRWGIVSPELRGGSRGPRSKESEARRLAKFLATWHSKRPPRPAEQITLEKKRYWRSA